MMQIEGPLGFATVGPWFAKAEALSQASTLSLAKVTHCDSAGVALLLDLLRRAQQGQRKLQFTDIPPQLRELSGFFGLDPVFGLT